MNDMTTPSIDPLDVADPGAIGRRRFLAGAGAVVGATTVGSVLPEGFAAAALPPGASNFHILENPVRLSDTRDPGRFPFERLSDRKIRVAVAGRADVPAEATAAIFTVTAVNFGLFNHATGYPAGATLPLASNLNMSPFAVNANMATIKLGEGGAIDVESLFPCHLIVDVIGYYRPVAGKVRAGRYVSLDTPRRAYDSRLLTAGGPQSIIPDNSFTTIDVTAEIPPAASAVVLNLTATECTRAGHFSVVPAEYNGPAPSTSSLNASTPGDTRASAVVCRVTTTPDNRRRIKVYSIFSAHLIVDVAGYYTSEIAAESLDGLFVPLPPQRIKDTRDPGEIGRLWPGWIVEAPLPASVASQASAVVMNVTGVNSRAAGFLTVTAARQKVPFVSNVNWTGPGAVVPNHVVSATTATYGVQAYSSHGAHVIFDLNGYFTGTPKLPRLAAPQNPPPPAAPPDWIMSIPKLGLISTVKSGDPGLVTDSGFSWHWTGTGYLGQNAHVAAFAHRTEAGGPYRNVHLLEVGDTMTVSTFDGREFLYRMVRRDLTDALNTNILNATRAHPGNTFSLIACTVGHDRTKSAWPDIWAPTSLKFRIVVTFELVSWREV